MPRHPPLTMAGYAAQRRNSQIELALSSLDVDSIRSYRARVRQAALAADRDPDDIRVLFVIKPVVVPSTEEADLLVRASETPGESVLLEVAEAWSSDLETDLTALDLDRPLDPASPRRGLIRPDTPQPRARPDHTGRTNTGCRGLPPAVE